MADKITQRDFNEIQAPPRVLGSGGAEVISQDKQFTVNTQRMPGRLETNVSLMQYDGTEYDDVIRCEPYMVALNGTANLETIWVFKPHHIQKTAWDGQTITYDNGDEIAYAYDTGVITRRTATLTVTDGDDIDVTQEITPDYYDGEILTVARLPVGVFVAGAVNAVVTHIDLNSAARGWGTTE